MKLLETVEDAFLSALEEGANPPKQFTVRLPYEAFDDPILEIGETLEVAGFEVILSLCDDDSDEPVDGREDLQ